MSLDFDLLWEQLSQHITTYGTKLLGALVILLIGRWFARWAQRGVLLWNERAPKKDPTLAPLLSRLVRWTVQIVALVIALDVFGIKTNSILALLGAAGLAVGLALKDTVSDVAAGLMLLALRPYDVGDSVDIEGTLGTIDEVDLFQTRITTFDGIPLVIPNAKVRLSIVRNFTRSKARRFDLRVGVSVRDELPRAVDAVRAVVLADTRVQSTPEPIIAVETFGDSAVNILVRAWTQPADHFPTQWDLTREIKLRFDAEGISVPVQRREYQVMGGPS